jgi:membrane protein DedA with SNARE-associated domain/pimeloyl-ACP methyl ester carboxylesterase
LLYVIALAASTLWQWAQPGRVDGSRDRTTLSVQPTATEASAPREHSAQRFLEIPYGGSPDSRVRVAYYDLGPSQGADGQASVVVLVHGSPGSGKNFGLSSSQGGVARALAADHRVLIPDLPGFGNSDLDVTDYSIDGHADALLRMLEALDVERAQVVGFSLGGGPALLLWNRAPERVASLVLLSSIGVQEMELMGDYRLNHAVHGMQLGALLGLRALVPHFGLTDGFDRGVNYARNFHESDQRPLRGILERFEPPLLLIHGERDFLVPPAAAREHHRIVPQSELWMSPGSHFMVFGQNPQLLEPLTDFLQRVDAGQAVRRADADPERLTLATRPFDPTSIPPASGPWLLAIMLILALGTLASEDLTCIAAGLMAAHGQLSWLAAASACFVGIFVGDMLLFIAGRTLGRAAVRRAPLRWLVTPAAIERCRRWFEQRGARVILISRFTPGLRLPTYVTAGLIGVSALQFTLWFLVAGLLWTPGLVFLSMFAGDRLMGTFSWLEHHPLLGVAVVVGCMLLVVKLGVPLFSHRGRRLLYGRWLRLTRWEFWPPWIFYPPLVLYIVWLGIKHRSLAVVTAVNPCMPAGGVVGESKADILDDLSRAFVGCGPVLPASRRIPAAQDLHRRVAQVNAFLDEHSLSFPVVLKPDAGERGAGVSVLRGPADIEPFLANTPHDVVAQEFAAGPEYGVFYVRHPQAEQGEIISITEKCKPTVVGDGTRSLEELMLDDARAPALAHVYTEQLGARLVDVPAAGEVVLLTDVGAHACGTVFTDGHRLLTPELSARIDALSRRIEGFYFGRYDIIAPSDEHLMRGEDLRIIELNGLTSESTHIYDARTSLFAAYRTLMEQWRMAFAIGIANRAEGAATTSVATLLKTWIGQLRAG